MTPVASLPAAGRALDTLVAEKVMGLEWRDGKMYCRGDGWYPKDAPECNRRDDRDYLINPPEYRSSLPNYSWDIAAAWEVVEKMLETHSVDVNAIPGESVIQWGATMQKMPFAERYPEHGACAKTAPLAICLAALEAVGGALKAVAP